MKSRQTRALLGGFVAALVAAVIAAVISSCGYMALRVLLSVGPVPSDLHGAFAFTAMNAAYLSARIALPAIVVAAVPYVLLSIRLRRSSLTYYVVGGALIGLGAIVVSTAWKYLYPMPPFHVHADDYFAAFTGTFAGAVAALVFWKMVRPDRLQHQSLTSR